MLVKPTLWMAISLGTITVSIVIIAALGLNWGIDFVGGSLLEVKSSQQNVQPIRQQLQSQFAISATVQTTPDGTLLIRLPQISNETQDQIQEYLQAQQLIEGDVLRFESIGPTVGEELRNKALIAVGLVVVGMILFLAYTFREASGLISPWKFGIASTYALVHDLLVITALFSILGKLLDVPIDNLFITAQLAIMGYSVNDTIVIFNRLNAEWRKTRSGNLITVIDRGVKATLIRSLNTALTTLLVLVALLLFGGTTIRWFVVALAAGTVVGAYSSIFVAPPLLYYLARKR